MEIRNLAVFSISQRKKVLRKAANRAETSTAVLVDAYDTETGEYTVKIATGKGEPVFYEATHEEIADIVEHGKEHILGNKVKEGLELVKGALENTAERREQVGERMEEERKYLDGLADMLVPDEEGSYHHLTRGRATETRQFADVRSPQ